MICIVTDDLAKIPQQQLDAADVVVEFDSQWRCARNQQWRFHKNRNCVVKQRNLATLGAEIQKLVNQHVKARKV